MKSYSVTDVGQKRQVNQDYVFASEEPVGNLPNLFVVADGMGGHKAGDFASSYAVQILLHTILEDENQNPISEPVYRAMLKQRGKEKKASWVVVENVDCEISVYNKSLVYKQDYDLGDISTVQYTGLGITVEKRITECIETWEDNTLSVNTIFGEDYLNFWNISTHK